MIYFTIPLTLLVLVAAYALHRYFNFKNNQLESQQDKYDDLTARLVELTATLVTLSARQEKFEARFDAITKNFLSEIHTVVKFTEAKVKATKSEAYKAITGSK